MHNRLRFTAALLVPVIVLFCTIFAALSLPQADYHLRIEGDQLLIANAPAAQGQVLSHFSIGQNARVDGTADLMIEEPDVSPTYLDMRALIDRIGSVTDSLLAGTLVATTQTGDTIMLRAVPRGPGDLPGVFWLQILCAMAAIIVCALIWSTVKLSLGSVGFILSGTGFALAAASAGIYSTRSLFIDADFFYWLTTINSIGTVLFGSSLILFLWNYPLSLWPRLSLTAALTSFVLFIFISLSEIIQDIAIARYLPMLIMLVTALIGLGVQWFKTRGKPAERLIVRWIAISVLLGTSIFMLLIALPIVFGFTEPAPQSFILATFLLMYLSIMLAVVRYRLFDLERWSFTIWTWLLGGLAVLVADVILASVLTLSVPATLTLSLALVGWIYFPLRQWLWKRFFLGESDGLERWLETSLPVMLQANESGQTQVSALSEVATAVFSPLDICEIEERYSRIAASRNGECLFIPLTEGTTLKLSHAAQGRRLFSQKDTLQAKLILSLYELTTSSVTARKEGAQQERQRMKRDLHDDLGAKLLQLLHRTESSNQPLVREAIADLRKLLTSRSTAEKDTLLVVNGWREEAEIRCADHNIKLNWQQAVLPAPMNARTFDTITSALRESLSNAVRHTSNREVNIQINGNESGLEILVTNPFADQHPGQGPANGNGLTNIRNRIHDNGGICGISQTDSNWRVQLQVSLK